MHRMLEEDKCNKNKRIKAHYTCILKFSFIVYTYDFCISKTLQKKK